MSNKVKANYKVSHFQREQCSRSFNWWVSATVAMITPPLLSNQNYMWKSHAQICLILHVKHLWNGN